MSAPPPPPPAQQPYRSSQPFDPKSVNQLDWAILGLGVLTLIFSFFDWYGYSPKGCGGDPVCNGYNYDVNAWHGFFGWFAVLLVLIGTIAVAIDIFAPQVKLPAPARLIGLAAWALGTLSALLAILVVPGLSVGGVDVPDSAYNSSRDWALFVGVILIIAGLVVSFMRFQELGGKLPNRSRT
jgi:hypothetical protein